jgi:hypothetical protein
MKTTFTDKLLSHDVVSSRPHQSRIQTYNVGDDSENLEIFLKRLFFRAIDRKFIFM